MPGKGVKIRQSRLQIHVTEARRWLEGQRRQTLELVQLERRVSDHMPSEELAQRLAEKVLAQGLLRIGANALVVAVRPFELKEGNNNKNKKNIIYYLAGHRYLLDLGSAKGRRRLRLNLVEEKVEHQSPAGLGRGLVPLDKLKVDATFFRNLEQELEGREDEHVDILGVKVGIVHDDEAGLEQLLLKERANRRELALVALLLDHLDDIVGVTRAVHDLDNGIAVGAGAFC